MKANGSDSAQDLEAQEKQEKQKEMSKDAEKLKEMEMRILRAEELRRIQFRQTIIQSDLIGLGVGIAQSSPPIILIILSSICTLLTALILFARPPIMTEIVDIPSEIS